MVLLAYACAAAAVAQTATMPAGKSRDPLWLGANAYPDAAGETVCIGTCDESEFITKVHRVVQTDLWSTTPNGRACTEAINEAIYRQDFGEFYLPQAHFDNCAFDESIGYLRSLIGKAELAFGDARQSFAKSGDIKQLGIQVRDGLTQLGRGLHIVQDFYAHTNYVELLGSPVQPSAKSGMVLELWNGSKQFSEEFFIPIWTQRGSDRVSELRSQAGLVSGTVWYEQPVLNRCVANSPTHSLLAKDEPNAGRGAERTRWPNLTYHQAAVALARKGTRTLLIEVSAKWPELEAVCGRYVRLIQPRDARSEFFLR